MKVFMISGSRNREGRTAGAMKALGKGIEKAGGEWEQVFLTEQEIERCRQCDADGWGQCRREGTCIIEDDFESIVGKIKAADVMVFANPVYFGDLSESMRAFLDRLRRTTRRPGPTPQGGAPSTTLRAGTAQPPPRPAGPIMPPEGATPAIGVCLSGGGGGNAPMCCVSLERVLQTCGFDVVDMIPLRRQNYEHKLSVMELTGEWLATKPTSSGG